MENIVDYHIEASGDMNYLMDHIKSMMRQQIDGHKWVPQGGVMYVPPGSSANGIIFPTYCQAMVLIKIR